MATAPHGLIGGQFIAQTGKKLRIRATTAKRDAKMNSMMPKNAINFYNLQKGLYLKGSSRKARNTHLPKDLAVSLNGRVVSKSMNLLNAYGELTQKTGETVGSPVAMARQQHTSSHAPPAAPAPGFASANVTEGELS